MHTNAALELANATGGREQWSIGIRAPGDISGPENRLNFMYFDGTGWAEKMALRDNGNVGIGTTDPQAKLHIGDGGSVALDGTDSAGFALGGDGDTGGWGGYWYGMSNGDAAVLNLSGTNDMDADPVLIQGFWGIGLRTDRAKIIMERDGEICIGSGCPY